MSSHREAVSNDKPYVDPNPLPPSVPQVDELGTTSAPLKSASFFIGDYCREVNGKYQWVRECIRGGRSEQPATSDRRWFWEAPECHTGAASNPGR